MRHLIKPEFDVKKIVEECSESYRDDDKKQRFKDNSDYIKRMSQEYDTHADSGDWIAIIREDMVNGVISVAEMKNLYEKKFAVHPDVRGKYYDKILNLAQGGKCPICGIGQVSNLDHYLAKSIYPTYTVTPVNLIPVCRDCNFYKLDKTINSNDDAPLHPYYEDVDEIEWLCAKITISEDTFVATYFINSLIECYKPELYTRLCNHFTIYKLAMAYSTQATTEIAENLQFWKEKYFEWGELEFVNYLKDCLRSKEKHQKNTWNTALLRALINDISIFLSLK
jgi:hypothetical protein